MSSLFRIGVRLTVIGLTLLSFTSFSSGGEEGRVLLVFNPQARVREVLPLRGVSKVSVRFFHSYDRQWVTESFVVKDGRLVPCEVIYRADSYDYRNERYESRCEVGLHDVKLIVTAHAERDSLAQVIYRVAHMKAQELILEKDGRQETYSFSRWGRPGQRLVLSLN